MSTQPEPQQPGEDGHLIGLIGEHIGGSFSPRLHETEAAAQGIKLHYRRIDCEVGGFRAFDLGSLLQGMSWAGFTGSNVTHPFKEAILPHLSGLSAEAAEIGAVNTIVPDGGRWWGTNTDWIGFKRGFELHLPGERTDRVLLVGAGGAGSAVAYATLKLGAGRLSIFDRDMGKAEGLVAKLTALFGAGRAEAMAWTGDLGGFDGIINATPIGMLGKPGTPFDAGLLAGRQWVADIIYFPLQTQLLEQARARGCRVMNGGGMVVFQGTAAFECFTGVAPDEQRVLAHFRREREAVEAAL